ncbi:hypothetical protein BH10BAC5_BH10BAC5_20160 [soil metagenome]
MKKIFLFLISVFIVSIIAGIRYLPIDPDTRSSGLKIASDSIIYNSTEYLKDVRRSNDGNTGFEVSVAEIMGREKKYGPLKSLRIPRKEELEGPDRTHLKQNPNSQDVSSYPVSKNNGKPNEVLAPQTLGVSFNGANLTGTNPTGSFPPDDMGDVGPTQYIVHVNGRIVSYLKSTGAADGVLNTTTDNFFASVMSANANTFTSDPRLRYDRLSKKWYFLIIDVPGGTGAITNRVLLGVSPDSVVTGATVFKYFFYQHSGTFWDYPTLGVDVNALYVGGNLFTLAGAFSNTKGIVINKASIQSVGPMVTTDLGNFLANSSSAGPYTPQGVDNPDPSATFGYFIGVDNLAYGTLQIRRVSNPGSAPTVSANITLTVPTTSSSLTVPHSGNTGGNNGKLDALDDRLFAATIKNGSLWTAHNIGVNSGGTTTSPTRDGSRWYQIDNLSTTPTLTQSGTVFDNSASAMSYWIPTIVTSGQGHSALVFSNSGATTRVNMGSIGRLSSDALGTMQTPLIISANASFAYNPPSDPGGAGGRRWGDYSNIKVDPNDDMTFWGINQWVSGANNYGCEVAQLKAPPPATPSSTSPSQIPVGANVAVTLTRTSVSGSGFFDPGSGFAGRLKVAIDGGVVVNSVTYINPTTINLTVNTTAATFNTTRTVTVTNPDGQITAAAVFAVLPVELASFTSAINKNSVLLKWSTVSEENNSGFDIERKFESDLNWKKINFVSGHGSSNFQNNYSFVENNLATGKYNYRLKQIDYNGNFKYYDLGAEVTIGIPDIFMLSQNYPNPFNPSTKIGFQLPEDSKVMIRIYDISGKETAVVINEQRSAGYYSHDFNASSLSSGIYFYVMNAESISGNKFTAVKKMLLVK